MPIWRIRQPDSSSASHQAGNFPSSILYRVWKRCFPISKDRNSPRYGSGESFCLFRVCLNFLFKQSYRPVQPMEDSTYSTTSEMAHSGATIRMANLKYLSNDTPAMVQAPRINPLMGVRALVNWSPIWKA